MTKNELVLLHLMEECGELTQACSKILRFGEHGKGPKETHTNIQNLSIEIGNVLEILQHLERIPDLILVGMRDKKKVLEKELNEI